ncbi:methyltransferase domain-containing protein [Natronobacterium gregoryi]|uniref:Methyltransferase domain-containing protein n=2 Tax=Natronobacterium gregoryi TaxID=44930 RepID=L0ADU8_NATGS|nr:methyltransferase domain-containing protein [Natronobacterium gregoryi]AFZ71589.1 protein-L-isoaspartate carboxylmethyltransferase [Natronobacterium gregoryi SP2]ELY66644.1 protein-L-isoaspartate carboxylmethyltransferase [Natronobacterium gregoryi SP2]PLK21356.1 methyltransferase domain-containing protein [Natronobacterium gregoryi SP2]SFI81023.1 Protein-L-isoaspartate(D-aspartate) O-methyltransferase (PCMT) [Natronobacterium gregoryi]
MGKIAKTVAGLEKSCTPAPLAFSWYTRFYRSVVDREIELADIDAEDRILNVGCGGMPFTTALLAKRTGATVYALDHDPAVVQEARRNLERAGVANEVEIVVGDGRDVLGDGSRLPESCSVAVVALQAEPKDEILHQYRNTTDGPERVVVRQPRALVAGDYDRVTDCEDRTGAVRHRMPTFDRSLLFGSA